MSNELLKLLSKDYTDALETEEFSDTEVLVGKEPDTKVFRLHSFVLKTRSPYFRIALSSNWSRIENNVFKLKKPNISAKIFDMLIKYIYSGTFDPSKQDVKTNITLLIAADELCLNGLCEYVEDHLLEDEESLKSNFVLIQHISNQFNHFTRLSRFFEETYRQDPSLIFRANDFNTIKKEILIELLTKNNHSLKPIQVWDKLMDWCIAQSGELPSDVTLWTANNVLTFKELIEPFIPHVKFEGINPSDFFKKIKPFKPIFDNDFYVKILEYYSFNLDSHTVKIDVSENIDSKIIDLNSAFLISSWIKLMKKHQSCVSYRFKLLVRGSIDGFKSDDFIKNCCNKGPTIIVARVKNTNEILGGFNPLYWILNGGCISTEESFIFSFDMNNLENFIFSKVADQEHAIYSNFGGSFFGNWGPDFGNGNSDLRLLISSTNKGQCYKESYEKLIRKEEGEFEISDYEVFQVIENS